MMSPNPNFDPNVDYYKVLGVAQDANEAAIKKAYRQLAKKFHPDVTGGDKRKESRFKEVSTAYDVLGNKDKRAQYDAIRRDGFFAGGIGGARGSASGARVDFGDLFSQMFGGGRPPGSTTYRYSTGGVTDDDFASIFGDIGAARRGAARHPEPAPAPERKLKASDGSTLMQKGHDVHSDLRLSIEEALLGAQKAVSTLGGKATVSVPPGTSSGIKLRLRGKGLPTARGGRGDHFVTVQIDIPKSPLEPAARKALRDLLKKLTK